MNGIFSEATCKLLIIGDFLSEIIDGIVWEASFYYWWKMLHIPPNMIPIKGGRPL